MAEFPLQYKSAEVNGYLVSTIVLDGGRGIAESVVFADGDDSGVAYARGWDRDAVHAEMVDKARSL